MNRRSTQSPSPSDAIFSSFVLALMIVPEGGRVGEAATTQKKTASDTDSLLRDF